MSRVLLVFPRLRYPSGDIPTGIITIAACLRERFDDLDLRFLDTTFHPSLAHVEWVVAAVRPDITGIFMDIVMAEAGLATAAIARRYDSQVIAGGPFPTIMPETVLAHDDVNAVCIGEGEQTMCDYVDAVNRGADWRQVPGLAFIRNGRMVTTPRRPFVTDLDSLPSPAFDLLDMKLYSASCFQLDSHDTRLRTISWTVSRGCPYQCAFCQPTVERVLGRQLRIRSPENVIRDLEHLRRQYGINAFYFADDLLTIKPDWIRRFCGLLKQQTTPFAWGCNTRADTLDESTMTLMKEAGLVKLKVGLEAITDRIRNGLYHKQLSRADIDAFLETTTRLNIHVAGFFMLGSPTETTREVWDTIAFAARSSLTEALFSITTPLPGSGLYDYAVARGWRPPTRSADYNYNQVSRPRLNRNEISPAVLRVVKKLAYLYFYLHPARIKKTLATLTSLAGLRKLLLKLKRV